MSIKEIAEKSKSITDSIENKPNMFGKYFDIIVSAISVGVFKSPPFSLENIFPGVDLFKNKYFKLVSIAAIYLGLIIYILAAFKPKNTRDMFLVYAICFWIAAMAFSILIVNPYDENSVEHMLRDKVIDKAKEILKGEELVKEKESTSGNALLKMAPNDATKMAPNDATKMAPNGATKMAPNGATKMVLDSDGEPVLDSNGDVLTKSPDGKTITNEIGDTFSIGADGKPIKLTSATVENVDLSKSLSSAVDSVKNKISIPSMDSVSGEQSSLMNTIKGFF